MMEPIDETKIASRAGFQWARRALLIACLLAVIGSIHPLVISSGPINILSLWEWITISLTGLVAAVTGISILLNRNHNLRNATVFISLWLAFHLSSNIVNALLLSPNRESALIYIAWLPVIYAFIAAILDVTWALRLATGCILTLVVATLAHFSIYGAPAIDDWFANVLIQGIVIQPIVIALIFSLARLREAYTSVRVKLVESRRHEKTLRDAIAMAQESTLRAERANQVKARFLASMSHELRTPLNAVIGFSQLIRDDILSLPIDKRYREYAADIQNTGQHLLNLVNGVLDVSRIESDIRVLSFSSTNLNLAIEKTLRMIEPLAQSKMVSVYFSPPKEPIIISADLQAIHQIVTNLVDNAIKFSPKGGSVNVSLKSVAGGAEIHVIDDGPGIAADRYETMFEPLSTSASPYENTGEGAGIGLYVTRNLVQRHGGKIELPSRMATSGAYFVVFLPETQ
ncbi:MAG: HAMP domain-containing histidine kinase [Parvibaculaceae bacterium]|nr:HAMP domain-containing histidine kinase [Parvibaculaceae bacterium]